MAVAPNFVVTISATAIEAVVHPIEVGPTLNLPSLAMAASLNAHLANFASKLAIQFNHVGIDLIRIFKLRLLNNHKHLLGFSKFTWLFPMFAKSDVFNIFIKFQK